MLTVIVVALSLTGYTRPGGDASVRLNQVQVIGAHNAYHREMQGAELAQAIAIDPATRSGACTRTRPFRTCSAGSASVGSNSTCCPTRRAASTATRWRASAPGSARSRTW